MTATKYYKHIGKVKNSGRRCVVIKDRIPGAEDKALIVDIDSLHDAYQQFLMDLVQSPAAQATNELGEVLNRYQSPDAGQTMLASLNNRQYLSAMDISNILMYPAPNFPIELSKVIKLVDGADKNEIMEEHSKTLHNTVSKIKADDYEQNEKIARNILFESQRLEFEAQKKRDIAYAMAPQLNPAMQSREEKLEKQIYQDVPETFSDKQPQQYNTPAPITQNVTVDDISSSIGEAPPPIKRQLTPEEEILSKICSPDYVPEKIVEDIIIEKKEPAKKRGRKAKAK